MAKDRAGLLLHEPNLYKSFLILSLPIFGANFLRAFNDMVDTYFIGQIPDSVAAQAGISSAWPPLSILQSFQVGFGVAGVAVISQLLGAGKQEKARENAGVLFILSIILGVLINALTYFIAPYAMTLIGAEGAAHASAVEYLRIRSFEMLAFFIFGAFQAVRQAQGDTSTPVYLSIASIAINIVLTAFFVRGMGLGAFGAGLATMIGQVAVAPICLYLLFSKNQPLHLTRDCLRFRPIETKNLVKISLPAAGSQALSSLGFLVLQMVVVSYGDEVTAAFSIGNKIASLLLMPVVALGTVLAAYVGQNIGAGKQERVKAGLKEGWIMGLCIGIPGFLLCFFGGEFLIHMFIKEETELALSTGMMFLRIVSPFFAVVAMKLTTDGVLRGAGAMKSFMVATFSDLILRVVLGYILSVPFGTTGIWLSWPVGWTIGTILSLAFYKAGVWKLKKKI